MAYVYEKAWVREIGKNKLWQELDIRNVVISTVLNTYADVVLVLSNSFISGLVSFRMTDHMSLYLRPNQTIQQWLVANGNTALPTTPGEPNIVYHKANYAAVQQVGFHMRLVNPDTHPNVYSPDHLLTDILLSRPNTDYNTLQRHSLICVNGIFHRTEATLHGVYVKEGGVTGKIGNDNSVGIVSFADVGELQYIPITPDIVYKQHEDQAYVKRAYIDTGMDLENKTVMMVIGGALHAMDETYFHMGNGQIAVRTESINFLQRFVELRRHINLHNVVQHFTDSDSTRIVLSELFSDEAILAFLTLPQSFLVVVDTPYLNTQRKGVMATRFPGTALSYEPPTGILKHRSGLASSYTRVKQSHIWSLQFKPQYERRYYFETTDWVDTTVVTDAEDILHLFRNDYGYLLEIGREVLTIE